MKLLLPLLLVSQVLVRAQVADGVAAPWDVAKSVTELSAKVAKLQPLVGQLAPKAWVEKGAPEAYIEQWESAKNQLGYMADASAALEKHPEKLTAALDTYFRMQAIEGSIGSLMEGVRKYEDPPVGDLLASTLGDTLASRDNLRDYINDLAGQREAEIGVLSGEAQRCRLDSNRTVVTPPPAASSTKKKAK